MNDVSRNAGQRAYHAALRSVVERVARSSRNAGLQRKPMGNALEECAPRIGMTSRT